MGRLTSVIRVASVPAVLYAGICTFMWAKQDELLFVPEREIRATPDQLGLAWEEVTLTSGDGTKLNARFVPAAGEARATVLHCHGNGGNVSYLGRTLALLHEQGMSTLVFDYRGYGKSEGSLADGDLSEDAVYRDADAAWSWLTNEKDVPPESVVLWGQSMGGGVCSWLAKERGGKALVLDSSFTSLNDVGAAIYWWLPVRLLSSFDFATVERLPALTQPVLVAHARDDRLVPFAHAERNFAAIKSRKKLIELKGGHNGGFAATPGAMEEAAAFLLDPPP